MRDMTHACVSGLSCFYLIAPENQHSWDVDFNFRRKYTQRETEWNFLLPCNHLYYTTDDPEFMIWDSLSLSLSLSHTHTHTLSLSLFLSLPLSLSCSHTHTLSLSLSLALSPMTHDTGLDLLLTHTYTHTLSASRSLSHDSWHRFRSLVWRPFCSCCRRCW